MFGAAAACRAKHRLQPCEPKPRPAEARRIYKSPFLTGLAPRASAREQHSADRSRACELTTYALSERSLWRGGSRRQPKRQASAPEDCGPRNSANCKTAERQKTAIEQPSANNYFLSILPRHYAASGLLNLQTTLTRAITPVTPGVKLL